MTPRLNADIQQPASSPLSIAGLRSRVYRARISLIKELDIKEDSFRSFLISYPSDKLNLFARINIPSSQIPERGFPVIVFAHGYSPDPLELEYFQRPYYETWINAYAKAGYLVVMPGYRGHGVVNNKPADGREYFEKYADLYLTSPFYAIDILNLMAGLSTISFVNWREYGLHPRSGHLLDDDNIFLAAHSMGGDVALAVLAVEEKFRAASIWAGVCADIKDITKFYTAYEIKESQSDTPFEIAFDEKWEKVKLAARKEPFVLDDINALNGLFYLDDLVTPMILHHGTQDTAVPSGWSVNLHAKLNELGKESTLYLYEGNDHELSQNDEHLIALERDTKFFNKHMRTW
jgi:dipeptidyl aminopeptidase/acylaminoacyl peptidase